MGHYGKHDMAVGGCECRQCNSEPNDSEGISYGVRIHGETAHIVEDAHTRCGADYKSDDGRTRGRWKRYESKDELPDDVEVCGTCEWYPDETQSEVRDDIIELVGIENPSDGNHFTKGELKTIRETLR